MNEEIMHRYFTNPADPLTRSLTDHFQYYADIAAWVQAETERAVLYIIQQRLALNPHENLAYAGGVALNAVSNAKIIDKTSRQLYAEPAAGDNGLAIGCAYYGWIQVLKKEKIKHSGNTCFGKEYPGFDWPPTSTSSPREGEENSARHCIKDAGAVQAAAK